jgi:hypothetical protein
MNWNFTLKVEIDADDGREAIETERTITEDLMCWPAVISVQGDVPKEAQ